MRHDIWKWRTSPHIPTGVVDPPPLPYEQFHTGLPPLVRKQPSPALSHPDNRTENQTFTAHSRRNQAYASGIAALRPHTDPVAHPDRRSLLETILSSTPPMRAILDRTVWLNVDLAIPELRIDEARQQILVQAMLDAARTIASHRPAARRAWIRMRLHHQHLVLLIADDGGPARDYLSSPSSQEGLSSLVRLAIALHLRLRFHRLRHLNVVSLRMPVHRPLNFKPTPKKEKVHENRQPVAA